ncbi:MAG: T9SS type A sorting domain-containing protein [Carboxylicivirga sp.]|jgi:hypothetical protein|nr:T9SS type A sorting domain-containing protein [Carboxylicivirga sp.]
MKKITLSLIFLLSIYLSKAQSFEFDTSGDNEGWGAVTNTSGTIDGGDYTLQVTASQNFVSLFNNSTIKTGSSAVNPSTVQYLHIVANVVPSTVKIINIRYNNGKNITKQISNFFSPGLQTYTVDMNDLFGTDWSNSTSLNNFRIRFVNQTSEGDLSTGTDIVTIDKIVFSDGVALGINDLRQFNFSFYPNPAKDKLHFRANAPIQKVQVYNLSGKELAGHSNVSHNSIDVSALDNGIYLVKIYVKDTAGTFKFVKR